MIQILFLEIDLIRAIETAYELDIYAYDAYMIECARNNNAPLLTLDTALISKARMKNIRVMEL